MTLKPTLGLCVLAVPVAAICALRLDGPVALFCRRRLFHPGRHLLVPFDLPDLLLPVVCLATGLAWAAFLFFRTEGRHDRALRCSRLLGITVPLANILKTGAKFLVGRVNTRYWLEHPAAAPFHWLDGRDVHTGFPSGHMAVFTVMAAGLASHYPKTRGPVFAGLAVLAAALVVTQYHFLSDILGGTCLGLLIHAGTEALLPNGRQLA